jgi:hypothetical protein
VYLVCVCVFGFDLFSVFIVFIMFFVFILVSRHHSRESVKIGPHPRGHPTSASFEPGGLCLRAAGFHTAGRGQCGDP